MNDTWATEPTQDRPVITLTNPEPWTRRALCTQTDPDAFFPEKGGRSSTTAKRICARCDVATQCLEYALRVNEKHGIYGGKSPEQRKRMRNQHES